MPSKLDTFMKGLRGLIDEYEKPDDRPPRDWSAYLNFSHLESVQAANPLAGHRGRPQSSPQSDPE